MFNTEAWQDAQAAAQQLGMEEAQAAPQQATDGTQATPTEVHDEPGIPQQEQQQGNVEDAAPQAAPQEQQQGIAVGEPDPSSPGGGPVSEDAIGIEDILFGDDDYLSTLPEDYDDWGFNNSDWEGFEDWDTTNYGDAGPGTELGEDTLGGYDGSGIAGGLGIDYGDESDERSPEAGGGEEDASEAQSDFITDADYQEVLDDLDHGNLDDVREFLEDLSHSDDDDIEEAKDAPGVPDEDGNHFVDEGISIGDIVGGEENVQEGLDDANNNTEEYTYDEEAYEDAQDTFESLRDALQHGDEEDRAEAFEELQGYLGGFDKGGAEDEENDPHNHGDPAEDQTGEWITGINGDIWVDASGDIWDSPEQAKAAAQLPQDEDRDLTGGDPEDVANDVVKEAVDAPDASGAAVSGPALGGAAVGAGAVAGEAGGLDEDLFKEVQDFFGDVFGGGEAPAGAGAAAGAGAVDQAIDAGTEWAGGAIDDALGIEGTGKVLENVAYGNFDEALGTITDSAGDYVGEWLDNEDLGDTFGEALNHVANGDFEEAFDTAVDGVGEALEDLGEDILGGIGGWFD